MDDVKVIATDAEVRAFLRPRHSGSGSGYGDGYGYGSGSGSGYGSGSGSGSGSGDGDGYGIKSYNGQKVYRIDDMLTIIEQVHGDFVRGFIVRGDLTLAPGFVARVENSYAHGQTIQKALNDAMEKALEEAPLDDRIARFVGAFPDPDAEVAFMELYSWHHVLTRSCTQGRDEFTREHGLARDGKYTPRYFIDITRNAYGKEAIRRLAEAYGITLNS